MKLRSVIQAFGVDPRILVGAVRGGPKFIANHHRFMREFPTFVGEFEKGGLVPRPADRYHKSGTASGHYFHQDLHVAQLICAARPSRHVDVGSRVDGFVAHVASFCRVEMLDIRPLTTSARNITFRQRDIMRTEPSWDSSLESLSCLHALEHFGLGRYGDEIDFYGHLKGWKNLTRMVKPRGMFYFS